MNLLAVIASPDFKRDASAAEEYVRLHCAGTATAAPHFDYKDGQVKGWRFVITGSSRTIARHSHGMPQAIALDILTGSTVP